MLKLVPAPPIAMPIACPAHAIVGADRRAEDAAGRLVGARGGVAADAGVAAIAGGPDVPARPNEAREVARRHRGIGVSAACVSCAWRHKR